MVRSKILGGRHLWRTTATFAGRVLRTRHKVLTPGRSVLRHFARRQFGWVPAFAGMTALWSVARRVIAAVGGSLLLLLLTATLFIYQLGPPPLDAATEGSVVVLDRDGKLLRPFTTKDGRWRLPVDESTVDPRYLAMLLAYEDKRFHTHHGVDIPALLRPPFQFLTSGHIRSGASTLTMQVARLLDGKHERTGLGKLRQIVRAIEIERKLTKPEILRLYLKLAPFGGNLEGVRAASLAYFGKEPLRLSVGEAALLVALPQSPEARRPDLHPDAARRARASVLARAAGAGVIDAAEATHANAEAVPKARRPFPQYAPHLSEQVVAAAPGTTVHRLTIDRTLQANLEDLARSSAQTLGPRLSLAMMVADHGTGEVLAYVGSPDYLDKKRFGAIDMASAVRSPGSTLKPLVYGLAFEAGIAHPDTLIDDKPTRFGRYAPKNFDDTFHGAVTIREALRQSLNVPAVKVLAAVGPTRMMARLKEAGIHYELPLDAGPSLAVGLGGVGLTLRDLTELYADIARGGVSNPIHHLKSGVFNPVLPGSNPTLPGSSPVLLGKVADWYIQSILRGTSPPRNAKGGDIAYKTGTSYGYRDAWAAGFDGKTTIAVWVGRPDGVPEPGITGVGVAAPILFDAFARLPGRRAPLAPAPEGAEVGVDLPPPLKVFLPDRLEKAGNKPFSEPELTISFPPDNTEIALDQAADGSSRPLIVKAEGGVLPLTWMLDDEPVASETFAREAMVKPHGKGFAKVSVVDATGRVDRVTVTIR